jgi:glycosyltransferase involved in cell wall biosynthesis
MDSTSISIVVPAYNERAGIAAVLDRLVTCAAGIRDDRLVEVVVVDDGSSDGTADAVVRFSNENPGAIVSVALPANVGLVDAMIAGARAARYRTVVFLDADLSYAPDIVLPLVEARARTGAAIAVASPYMKGGRVENVPPVRLAASRGANWLLSRVVGSRLHTFTGMVRAYDRADFLALAERTPVGEFNAWTIATTLADGFDVVEIPAALVWPVERTSAPSRLTLGKLWQRSILVLETMRVLGRAMKSRRVVHGAGTFALSTRTNGPFSTKA